MATCRPDFTDRQCRSSVCRSLMTALTEARSAPAPSRALRSLVNRRLDPRLLPVIVAFAESVHARDPDAQSDLAGQKHVSVHSMVATLRSLVGSRKYGRNYLSRRSRLVLPCHGRETSKSPLHSRCGH